MEDNTNTLKAALARVAYWTLGCGLTGTLVAVAVVASIAAPIFLSPLLIGSSLLMLVAIYQMGSRYGNWIENYGDAVFVEDESHQEVNEAKSARSIWAMYMSSLGASGTLICQSSLEFSNFLLVLVQLGAWAIFGIAVLATSMPKGNVSRIETLREKLKQIGNPTSD